MDCKTNENENCIFCKISNKNIPAKIVYEDDKIIMFNDLNPVTPVHILAIPKTHITSAKHINAENSGLIAHIFEVIAQKSEELGLKDGYRIINNCGESAGQTVMHLHFHILGGKELGWPGV